MSNLQKIIIIGGTTCSGKTEISLELSNLFPVEIVNFDSMCFYRHFNIGTAKPEAAARAAVRHHLIDIKNPDEEYNAQMFSDDARLTINDIITRGKIPLFIGGTGLYMRSLIYGLSLIPISETDKAVYREKAAELIRTLGVNIAYEGLKKIDPAYANRISKNDIQRITRAYEVFEATGRPFSHYLTKKPFDKPLYDFMYFSLIPPRDYLKQRIEERTETILKKGLTDEIKTILNMNYKADSKPFGGIGYKEGLLYLSGSIKTRDELYLRIISSTLQYAKRQATFFRKVKDIVEINRVGLSERVIFTANLIKDFLK
ncbi:tRNA (adenosine(37)-N6)-dimethylallyltransferase MiaA [Candidatus Acidulodesulfobacterium sp. H_13]|uniref:tRNA (adenosine(37)-N6)-dimethylallyltransferase MiaA n=1 Tax=Candidatus Acidulodesulfobacterium sp. H_13 TaxID=3395470 RepID=UPI003AF55412